MTGPKYFAVAALRLIRANAEMRSGQVPLKAQDFHAVKSTHAEGPHASQPGSNDHADASLCPCFFGAFLAAVIIGHVLLARALFAPTPAVERPPGPDDVHGAARHDRPRERSLSAMTLEA